jgi:dynein heavy chain
MAENNESESNKSMKELNKKQNDLLRGYVEMLQGNLTNNMRTKISAICTIEAHSKDVVANLIEEKVKQSEFAWQSQLRFYWDK